MIGYGFVWFKLICYKIDCVVGSGWINNDNGLLNLVHNIAVICSLES